MHVATLIELRIGCQAGALSSLEVAIDGLLDVSAAAVRAVALQRIPLLAQALLSGASCQAAPHSAG